MYVYWMDKKYATCLTAWYTGTINDKNFGEVLECLLYVFP